MPLQPDRRPFRRGFTILELLVTFGIICVLLAILLPAVGIARQAARRTQCQNNLKQIGLALVNYHETYNIYPPGYVSRNVTPDDGWQAESGPGFAWGLLLLDFLDQAPLATMFAYDLDATDPAHMSTMATVLPCWRCPAGESPKAFDVTVGLGAYILGSSSYVGMYGLGDLTQSPGKPKGPGVLYRNSSTSTWSIGDGLSNTILVSERSAWHNFEPGDFGGPANSSWFAAIPGASRPAGDPDRPLLIAGPASLVLGSVGLDDTNEGTFRPRHTNHIAAFSSDHEGGFHVQLGDSSVRFLSDRIDAATFRHLGQHSDAEVLNEF